MGRCVGGRGCCKYSVYVYVCCRYGVYMYVCYRYGVVGVGKYTMYGAGDWADG